ncbi:MAG: hypothetical protein IAF02_11480, partial [Anaerolineae bacterium]|nr:hypothetical protein [Anaerolineae bacterium]
MNDELTEKWSEQIAETAVSFPYPETPDIAGAVQQRLQPQPVPSRTLRWAVALALFVVLLSASLLAIPPVRAAVFEWLRIGAIEVFVVEDVSVVETPALSFAETAVPLSILDLGEAISLEEAQAIFPEPLRQPVGWDAAAPVYSQQFLGRLPTISMQWQTADGVTVTLSQIAAPYLGMKWASGEQVVETAVAGETAVWLEGTHPLRLKTGEADMQITIDSNVLIWTEGTITYRLEGQLSLAEAV